MLQIATLADKLAAEADMPLQTCWTARTLYEQLVETSDRFPERPAISFQLKSGPKDKSVSVTWRAFREQVTQAANLFRSSGIGAKDAIAYVLPNGVEAPLTLVAGATAGIVSPINPLLSSEHIGGILKDTRAKAVVTLAPFPQTDVAQKVAEAVGHAPEVKTIFHVDLSGYLPTPLAWAVPMMRPKYTPPRAVRILDLHSEMSRHRKDRLDFEETQDDRVCAYFHTGGTTGLPKVAQHRPSGILYNGWCGKAYMFTEEHVLICPLPMFHVLAAYPIFMSCLMSGAQIVFPTPQGYRGVGVIKNFWKLVERYKVTFMVTVPTASSALMQRPVDADVSTLRQAISGSAAMPVELFERFETSTGVQILEGYGMTEATCLVSINPPFGERKIGSVGLPFPHTDVKIRHCDAEGVVLKECVEGEVGEICVLNPGVRPDVYTDCEKNRGVVTPDGYLRTGDLGQTDADGYVWITGRAKDLIIRGGHNIDPAIIEEALMAHPAVAFAGAIGQPDKQAGEVPAAYVELVEGAKASLEEIEDFARQRISERAAVPKHFEVMRELPKTAVGKVFKPDLRRSAITRVFDRALEDAGLSVRVAEVVEDKRRGLVAHMTSASSNEEATKASTILGAFTVPWIWQN